MNAGQKSEFRRTLLEERERIVAEWKSHGGSIGPGTDWNLRDPEERATQVSSTQIDLQIAEDDANLLEKVEFAIRRVEDDTYEQCTGCGGQIPMERLRAKPSVSLCVACQEEKDARKA